jgi:lantibiotic modifying enzyme
VAVRCGQFIMTGSPDDTQPGTGPEAVTGIDTAAGRAHGLAGVTEFLLTLAGRTGEQPALAAAAQLTSQLAARTRGLLPAVSSGATMPIAVSWCRGLAGIGQVLLHASRILHDPALASLAREAADACIVYTPRLSVPARCCCAAGVGQFLIDIAVTGQNERYWQAAQDIGRQMLHRSGVSWAFGIAGILPFFRRLARQGETDSLPLPSP